MLGARSNGGAAFTPPGRSRLSGRGRAHRDGSSRADVAWKGRGTGGPEYRPEPGSVGVRNREARQVRGGRAGRDDRVPPAAGILLREVFAMVGSAALLASQGRLGDQAADEHQIAGLDAAARHWTETEFALQP